jgi:hypothetical protein
MESRFEGRGINRLGTAFLDKAKRDPPLPPPGADLLAFSKQSQKNIINRVNI